MAKDDILSSIDTVIRNATTPLSITHTFLADLLTSMVSFSDAKYNGLTPLNFAVNGSFGVSAGQKLISIHFQNNTNIDMNILVNYVRGGANWATVTVPANSTADLDLGKVFWNASTIFLDGVTGNLSVLIDTK